MKVAISLLIVCVVIAVESVPSPLGDGILNHRTKRGFRNGAADRFSHGFGKRTDSSSIFGGGEDEFQGSNKFILSNEFVRLVRSSSKLATMIVEECIDTNGDGLISREEITENNLKR